MHKNFTSTQGIRPEKLAAVYPYVTFAISLSPSCRASSRRCSPLSFLCSFIDFFTMILVFRISSTILSTNQAQIISITLHLRGYTHNLYSFVVDFSFAGWSTSQVQKTRIKYFISIPDVNSTGNGLLTLRWSLSCINLWCIIYRLWFTYFEMIPVLYLSVMFYMYNL